MNKDKDERARKLEEERKELMEKLHLEEQKNFELITRLRVLHFYIKLKYF
jgi:hypothetical protein